MKFRIVRRPAGSRAVLFLTAGEQWSTRIGEAAKFDIVAAFNSLPKTLPGEEIQPVPLSWTLPMIAQYMAALPSERVQLGRTWAHVLPRENPRRPAAARGARRLLEFRWRSARGKSGSLWASSDEKALSYTRGLWRSSHRGDRVTSLTPTGKSKLAGKKK